MVRYLQIATFLLVLLAGQGSLASDAGYVVIVSAENPVERLDAYEVVDIFLGRRGQFPDGRLAQPVDLKESNAARDVFYRELLQRNPAQIRAHWSRLVFTGRGKPPQQARDSAEVVDIVAGNPNAIGYVDPEVVDDSVRIVRVVP